MNTKVSIELNRSQLVLLLQDQEQMRFDTLPGMLASGGIRQRDSRTGERL